jgi:hypothetical protein
MRKLVVSAAIAAAVISVAGTVSAGQPVEPACVGETVSTNAKTLHPLGQFNASVAPRNDFGTIGDAVQAIQAGQVPDDVYPNACN